MTRRGKVIRGRKIRGSGGDDSNGKSRPAIEDRNNLFSGAWARIVDLLGEGEIEGLVNGFKSIYLNEVPIQNANGSFNFPNNIEYFERTGTQDQSYIPNFSNIESETPISQELRATTEGDIVREVTDPNVTRLRVKFSIPQLTAVNADTGDTHGSNALVLVQVQPSGGSYSTVASRYVSGKCTSQYEFSLQFALTGDAPWNVKVVRTTPDSPSGFIQNKTYLQSIVEVVEAKLRYPNSALVAIKFDAQSFDRIPDRYYDVKLLKIRIPSNASVRTDGSLTFSGPWDGTFDIAWCSDPAWVFYDLCTNTRYGLGAFIPEDQIDKWSLFEISQYCSELVDDGFGGTEPRFSCNMLLQDRAEAYSVLQHLASVFRGMIYWSAGAVTATQDAPSDAVALYTTANVVDGRFTYQGSSLKTRHTVALVTWNDPEDFYRQRVEYVEDLDGIAQFGVQQTDVIAFGCTSRGQAHRFGRWLLYTEQNEGETVTFKTGLEGIAGRPGQVIKVADPSRAGLRMGGRIASGATTTHIPVDQIAAGSVSGFTLSVMLPDGSVENSTVISSLDNTIEVQPGFSVAPNTQSIWLLRSDEVEPQTFRVISVTEEAGGIFSITAIKHNPDKYDAVENNLILEVRNYSALKAQPDSPSGLIVTESLYQTGTDVKAKATISWDKVNLAKSYRVKYKFDDNNWVEMPETSFNDQDILDVQAGSYSFQVFALNSFGIASVVSTKSAEIFGKLAPPEDVTSFSMMPVSGNAFLTWDQAPDLDVLVGGQVRIRHSPLTVGAEWNTSIDIVPAVPGTATSVVAPLLSGTYLAKFLDSTGHYSTNEVMIETTIPYGIALNVVHTETEDPTFPGTLEDMQYISSDGGSIALASGALIDDLGDIDDIFNWDFPAGIVAEGTYLFANTVDLGGVWPTRILSRVQVQAFDIGNDIDSRTDLMDDWADLDGSFIDDVNATLYVRTTEDDPSGAPTWTDWKRIAAGEYLARGFQFKIVATSDSESHSIKITGLEVTLDLADRAINGGPVASGVGATYRVNFSEPFFADPALTITANNMGTGDFYTITNSDKNGFDIVFKIAAGTIVSKNFSYIAKGYGRKTA